MAFMDKSVDRYLHDLVPGRDAVLGEIEALAAEKRIPIVGPAVGKFLEQMARTIGARRVFEMGSAVGYSTIWWARAVGPGGQVYYTDGSVANAVRATGYLQAAGLIDRVELLTGNAWTLLPKPMVSSTLCSTTSTSTTIRRCTNGPLTVCGSAACSCRTTPSGAAASPTRA